MRGTAWLSSLSRWVGREEIALAEIIFMEPVIVRCHCRGWA